MALACLACHALDNSTDSFRMDRSFRTQNMSVRSVNSDDGQEGCGGVATCFSKHNNKTTPHNDRQQRLTQGGIVGGRTFRESSTPSSKVSQRGGSLASFGRQQPDVSLDRMVFPEPRLTRCHAVRRDLFSDWTVGEIETEFGGRQICFNLSSTTA
ncbi:unnamed protein product [Calypogeia fissa]